MNIGHNPSKKLLKARMHFKIYWRNQILVTSMVIKNFNTTTEELQIDEFHEDLEQIMADITD